MTSPQPIVCKPTPWFRYRASLITLMFGVFAVLFYIDGSTGYREDNLVYVLHQAFNKDAKESIAEMNADNNLSAEQWREFAKQQIVKVPDDPSLLPEGTELPMPWPEPLQDIQVAKTLLKGNQAWEDYSKEAKLDSNPPEKLHTAGKIREQWIVFYICLCLTIASLFVLIRTSTRNITATDEALIAQDGRTILYAEFNRLDLRKWDNKGIAIAQYNGSSGSGRVRIDGLTYGGFKKEVGSPAEKLMERLRSHFSGEIIEYAAVTETVDSDAKNQHDASDPKSDSRG